MRAILKPLMPMLKWPVRLGAFLVQLLHHLAAFFAWVWMAIHVAGALAQAGVNASRIWEAHVLEDIWREGLGFFAKAGGADWPKILVLALIPACLVACRNAYVAYEQLHAWVHEHRTGHSAGRA